MGVVRACRGNHLTGWWGVHVLAAPLAKFLLDCLEHRRCLVRARASRLPRHVPTKKAKQVSGHCFRHSARNSLNLLSGSLGLSGHAQRTVVLARFIPSSSSVADSSDPCSAAAAPCFPCRLAASSSPHARLVARLLRWRQPRPPNSWPLFISPARRSARIVALSAAAWVLVVRNASCCCTQSASEGRAPPSCLNEAHALCFPRVRDSTQPSCKGT